MSTRKKSGTASPAKDPLLGLEALLTSAPEDALELLLEEWRASFDPRLSQLIERLGAQLAIPLEGLPAAKGARAEALAGLARTGSVAQRSAVLSAFEDFAREAAGRLVWPAVEAWVTLAPDPRVARMALRVLTADQRGQLTGKLWRRLVGSIEHHGDVALVEAAREYEAALQKRAGGWGASSTRFTNVLKKLSASRTARAVAHPEVLDRLLSTLAAPVAPAAIEDEGAMLEAIARAPDDDTPRAVYADWLTERQRPAGEFIVLQLQRARGAKAGREREAELLASHRSKLLGPLEPALARAGLRFERGFAVAAKAAGTLPAHPLTRLLERLDFGTFGFSPGARFDALEEATGPFRPLRDALPELAPRLTRWTVRGNDFPLLMTSLEALQLTELTISYLSEPPLDWALERLFANPGLQRLERLSFEGLATSLAPLVLAKAPASLAALRVASNTIDGTWSRGADGWSFELNVSHFFNPRLLADTLELICGATPLVRARVRGAKHKADFTFLEQVLKGHAKQVERVKP